MVVNVSTIFIISYLILSIVFISHKSYFKIVDYSSLNVRRNIRTTEKNILLLNILYIIYYSIYYYYVINRHYFRCIN